MFFTVAQFCATISILLTESNFGLSKDFGKVRTAIIEDKAYFVASDVVKTLGYSNTNDVISRRCRWVVKHHILYPQSSSKQMLANVICARFLKKKEANRWVQHLCRG